jgi:malonyl-CoA O-methyltransferase
MSDSSDHAAPRPVHDAALARVLRRFGDAPSAPWLHGEVAQRMAQRLSVVRLQPRVLIDWWAFAGASAAPLRQAYPLARRMLVEPTDALRSRSAVQAPWWTPRRWLEPAATVCLPGQVPAAGAELVWATMMLHWVRDPAEQMRQWQGALAVDGFVMFSTLGPGSLATLAALYARAAWPAPFAPFVDMHDLGDMLLHAGVADPVMDQEVITLTWPDSAALRAELRTLGGNADPRRAPGLRTPRWRERLDAALDALRGADGRLQLDFEVVYGHAFKAAPRPRVQTHTTVPLDEMRSMVRSPRRAGGAGERLR